MTRKEEKQQLRRTVRALERELSPKYKEESSKAICQHLIAMPAYQSANTVFCFVGMSREIDTTLILEDALNSGKRLCVPLCVGDGIMELRHITALDQLVPGAYGILEPSSDTPLVATDDVDFAVLPCVSCNHAGQRLGQGGGFGLSQKACFVIDKAGVVCREGADGQTAAQQRCQEDGQ